MDVNPTQIAEVSATNQAETTAPRCPACLSGQMAVFLDLGVMPTQIGIQWPSQQAARGCPRGSMRLAACNICGYVNNLDYELETVDYQAGYDNDLSFSSVYQAFEDDLVERLIRTYDLRGKRILEIGCGHGKFLRRLCQAGGNSGIGFDPSYRGSGESDGRVQFVADYYPDRQGPCDADLIVCRQVFEHIPRPVKFLRRLRATIPEAARTPLYVEVPSFDYVLKELALWTLIYEHCSYFTRASATTVFERAGFEVRRAYDCFDGQFLAVEAAPADRSQMDLRRNPVDEAISERIAEFAGRLKEKLSRWRGQMRQLLRDHKRVVVWGAGARAVCFFNLIEGAAELPCIVDINPNKIGKYVPGTGQQIVGPAVLPEYRPDVVIVMNPIYGEEIRRTVEALGLHVQFLYA